MKSVKNVIMKKLIFGQFKLELQMRQRQNSLSVSSASILGENIGKMMLEYTELYDFPQIGKAYINSLVSNDKDMTFRVNFLDRSKKDESFLFFRQK